MRKLLLLVLSLLPLTASGQSMITVPPQQCVWRAGDDPAWAMPNLDETGWQPSAQWKLPLEEPHLWTRCHADLAPLRGAAHPAIQISLAGAYELFVNGVRVGGAGNVQTGFYSMNTIRQYPLPLPVFQTQPVTIALRMTNRDVLWTTSPLEIQAGDAEVLAGRRAIVVLTRSQSVLRVAFWYPLIGVAGLMLLGLFYYDRSRRDLLYLSVLCACQATLGIAAYCDSALMNIPWALSAGMLDVVDSADTIVSVVFFFALVRRRVPLLYRIAAAAGAANWLIQGFALMLPPERSVWILGLLNTLVAGMMLSAGLLVISIAPFVAFWPYRQISPRMRPIAALCLLYGVHQFVWFGLQITTDPRFGLPNLFAYWERGLLEMGAFLTTCVLAGLLALLFRDQRQVTEERALLAGEMQAAQDIQRALVPASIDTLPGLKIAVAFHPVRDVGGDFYSCTILPGGRQRILLGDVSGKGAAAAMTAAVLLGATQKHENETPAALLRHLNGVLKDMHLGGFATCVCAELTADDTLTVANAGHLSPYRNGSELPVPSGMPLGLVAEASYEETSFEVAPGDRLTFLSDGVVEARNSKGELLGFERMAPLTIKPTAEIAQAAQRWGQEDDITVLTVTRVPKLEVATA